jgi:hypothetical protein
MATIFGVTSGIHTGERELCSDYKCGRYVEDGAECFWDEKGAVYCADCGKCLRYARKKEAQREVNCNVLRD